MWELYILLPKIFQLYAPKLSYVCQMIVLMLLLYYLVLKTLRIISSVGFWHTHEIYSGIIWCKKFLEEILVSRRNFSRIFHSAAAEVWGKKKERITNFRRKTKIHQKPGMLQFHLIVFWQAHEPYKAGYASFSGGILTVKSRWVTFIRNVETSVAG